MTKEKSVIISERAHDQLDKIKEVTHVPLKYVLEEAIQDMYQKTMVKVEQNKQNS